VDQKLGWIKLLTNMHRQETTTKVLLNSTLKQSLLQLKMQILLINIFMLH